MATAELEPVYLISGSDRPKIELAVTRLRSHFDPSSVDVVTAVDEDGAAIVRLCNAGTLFGDRRLVVVNEVDGRRDGYGRLGKGWKAPDLDAVVAYLAAPAPATVLCLVAEEVTEKSSLAKACAKGGKTLFFSVVKSKLAPWVRDRFRQLGVDADLEACSSLVEIVGEDLVALASEVQKLASWADGEPVGTVEVEALAVAHGEPPIWALTDAWARRDAAAALGAMERLYERSDQPRRSESSRMAGALGGHLARMRQMKQAAAEGKSSRDVATALRMHPFRAQKALEQADGFSWDELDDATVVLGALDFSLRGGSRLAPDLEVQRAITALARQPGR
jgi:DNA polymerase-3 subunit delta